MAARLAEFAIVGRPMPPGSTRNITGTLGLVKNGVVLGMGDGGVRDMTRPSGRKFRGTLECEDLRSAPLFGLWLGSELTIDVIDYVEEPVAQPQVRPHVPGTLHYLDAAGFDVPQAQGVWRRYQPRLDIIIYEEGWEMRIDNWGAKVRWAFPWRER